LILNSKIIFGLHYNNVNCNVEITTANFLYFTAQYISFTKAHNLIKITWDVLVGVEVLVGAYQDISG